MGHTVPKMSKLVIVVFSLGLISACVGQVIQIDRECDPDIEVIQNFDANKYAGTWYDIQSLPSTQSSGTCNLHTWTNAAGGGINLRNSQVVNRALQSVTATAVLTTGETSGTAKYTVTSSTGGPTTSNYWVLDTDYETFALVYSCRNLDGNRREVNAWKLGRNTGLLPDAANVRIDSSISKVEALSAAVNQFQVRSHSAENCYASIELPGACPIVAGVPSFNIDQYLGAWNEVARYPNDVQRGQCARAEYATGDTSGDVSVKNSEVIGQALSTITGTARLTDQSGVLEVELNVVGAVPISSTLHVLATDYENYALVYSCANIDGNRRRISSWNLRKTARQLSNEENARIDDAIASVDGLDRVYFQETSQSDAACFYYPEYDVLPDTIDLPGSCPTIPGVVDFNLNAYLGTWYEVARYPNQAQTGQCNRAEYATGASSGVVSVENSEVIGQALNTILGNARPTDQSGILEVELNVGGVPRTSTLHVLATDYESYALVYSCANIDGNRRRVSSWKLSRSTDPLTVEQNAAINAVISTTEGLRNDYYLETSQSDAACFYYPDYDVLPGTIELRGSCPTIPGVADFNLNAYLGTWYEVARYPNQAQTGQCNRAEYATGASSGVVSVENSEVIGQALNTILGNARPTDQSGILEVELNVGGVPRTSTLHVLATDYESYALVYSCANIDGNRRRVSSWKLSRSTDPLTVVQNAAINAVISTTEGLRNDYYLETSQSDAACFYYPDYDVLPGTIELRGSCPTIPGVADFNLNAYLGTWYEVARYPNQAQTGQCNRAEYATGASSGVVSVENSEVIGQALNTILGNARPTDQSGILEVELNVGGVPRTSTLHVLATDYESYALVYSCANIDGNRRRVSSWKLSRSTDPLTVVQNAAINAVISTTEGLRNDYYLETSQSDAACFYYPEYDVLPGTIELRGSCPTIPGVADFNLNAYLGTWYEVARYPNQAQTGQCNRAEYATGASSGVVSVENSEVIGQALNTILGNARPTDQSGILEVELNVGGVPRTSTLHVLATDYESYALVYSCANIDGNRRRVSSWKLSKSTNPLTDEQNAKINEVISSTEGLRNDYYLETSQSDAACFYLPEYDVLPDTIDLPGSCPTIPGVADFNLNAYLGTWYEVARYPNLAQTGQCNRAEYAPGTSSDVVSVENSEVIGQALNTILGNARTTDQSGVLEVELNVGGEPRTLTLHVLATDYDNYALMYSCVNIDGDKRRVSSWKLSKSTNPLTDQQNAEINTVVSQTDGLVNHYYLDTSQSDAACFYYPEYDVLPGTIELRGSCPTVPGVADFNLNAYLGTWYEVARYPNQAQTGQCNRAEYATGATSGVVSVENSEVIGQALNKILGNARLTDQSGVLEVELNVGGAPRTLTFHVLATDYENYALVYSCANIDGNRRRVSSWKLSKSTNPLTDAQNAEINEVVSTTEGLRNDYYLETSQSDAACFYYPEYDVPPGTIELRGSCPTIPGVADFNLNAYLGTWYEVARYPNQAQTGQCNRAEYATGATDVVSVENTEVIGQALNKILGNARLTDQSGVLEVELNVEGVPRTLTFHVLATDYENYALVYSCANIDGNRRRVSSWKLSKSTNPLTDAQNDAINEVVSTTEGLRNDYYLETSQSDAACFYYPDYDVLPETIELRGPCPAIAGVPDFNLNAYLGTWYEVARYPNQAQTGQCNRAEYATGATSDVVSVENSEVIGQALNTILGNARLTDQSGVLEVELNVEGARRTLTFHVLATDYENYALVYSCANIDGNRRRVSSWKLSKSTNPLTDAQNAEINEVVSTTEGLRNDYYLETSQSDAACFYYPDYDVLPETIELRGPCPAIAGVPDFNLNAYLGTWYEVARYPNQAQTGQCNRAEYATGATSDVVSVENSEVIGQALNTILGNARLTDQSGVLEVELNVEGAPRTLTFHVLATDYENYALVYSCANIDGNRRRVSSWKLSKSTNPLTDAQNSMINAVISTTEGLRNDYYLETSQSDAACFYYPDYDVLPETIELRGPCPAIAGVPDFNLDNYLGSWYEVARYPQPAQTGQCNRAEYSRVDDSISVVSSQVTNEELRAISGVVSTTSQPGVLEVQFDVDGGTRISNFHVLATDYTNYALVYSCVNIEGNRRRVGSWILSRSTSALDDEANTAMEVVIRDTQGLNSAYYQSTSQSDTDCFFYPTQSGEHVVIPGRCDSGISGVRNINLTRFTNESVWYQIHRYDAVEGTCIGTRLTQDGVYININHIERFGDEVERSRGVALLNSTQNGMFTFEMEDTGKEEIYIMATDYDGYAIAYNCKNIGTNERQVGVWQLSRTRTMPSAGETALNQLIATRQEFTNRPTYFKQILHPSTTSDQCPEPSSAFLFKSSIIVIFVCIILQFVW